MENKKVNQKEVLKRVFSYVSKYKLYLFLTVFLTIICVGLTLIVPKLTGHAIDFIIGTGNVNFNGVIEIIVNIALSIIITSIVQWIVNICNNKMTYSIIKDIRTDALSKIEDLPLSYIDSHPSGDIVSRIVADTDQFADGLLLGFTQLFTGVATIIGTLIFMITINLKVAILVVILTPIPMVISSFIAGRTFAMFRKQSLARGEETGFINEMVAGQKDIRAFEQEKNISNRFDEYNEKLRKYSLKAVFYSSLVNPCTRLGNNMIYAVVAAAGALSVVGGGMTVGLLSSFLSYATQYTRPFNEISGIIAEFQNSLACADRVFKLIDERSEEPDSKCAISLEEIVGNIDINDVSFSYDGIENQLKNIGLSVRHGQNIAIVGPTGCGKTTLINLLMRFYDASNGSIYVDGNDIKNITKKTLRKSYGMVLQNSWLKSGTIRENIAIGKPDATFEEIVKASKLAYCHNFIIKLPNAYDTYIGEEGKELSQGQKQLLCLARVILYGPSLLILDEATSSIDTRTELKIQDVLRKIMKDRTSFVVAHRLSTIKEADEIIVMNNGKIVQRGTHDSLLSDEGLYHDLYMSQFKGNLI